MRHLKKGGNKLGRSAEHRKSLLRNLMISLIEHRKIQTTKAKAKAVQPAIESLLALAREDTPHARQIALSPEQYAGRNGGFTRITKLGPRLGDGAEVVVLELL